MDKKNLLNYVFYVVLHVEIKNTPSVCSRSKNRTN